MLASPSGLQCMMNVTVDILLAGNQNVNKIGSVHWNIGIVGGGYRVEGAGYKAESWRLEERSSSPSSLSLEVGGRENSNKLISSSQTPII